MEMVCVMPVMGNDIFKLSSQGQLDWIEILSTDENFNRMSSMIRLEDISLMEYQHINNLLREPYKVRKKKNVWKFPYLWGWGGSDQGQFPYNF